MLVVKHRYDVSTSNEYDGGVSTSEEENNYNYYCTEYGLNHVMLLLLYSFGTTFVFVLLYLSVCLLNSFVVQVCNFLM